MIMTEAQQRERIAHGVGSMALALDVLVLIVLAKFVGPIYAIVWLGLSVIGGVAHFKIMKSLAAAECPVHPKGTPGDWAYGRHLKWRECTCSDDPSPRNEAAEMRYPSKSKKDKPCSNA